MAQRPLSIPERCPDGGTCHHDCPTVEECFRVAECGPLSGVFPNDEWPETVKQQSEMSESDLTDLVKRAAKLIAPWGCNHPIGSLVKPEECETCQWLRDAHPILKGNS